MYITVFDTALYFNESSSYFAAGHLSASFGMFYSCYGLHIIYRVEALVKMYI